MAMTKFKVESGVQLLARLIKKPVIENFYPNLFQPGPKYDDVVEIYGNINSSYLLIDLISEALLPSKPNEEPVGVLVFNTVGLLNYQELIDILNKRIVSRKNTNFDCKTETYNILNKTLSNLFLLDIYDATQFYITIHNLESILAEHQNICLVIFDTLTAFFWSEQGFKITKMDLYVKNLLKMIQKVCKEYKVVFVYTRPGYFNSSKDTSNVETNEVQVGEGVNFRVQLIENNATGAYQVNIRTLDTYYKKYFNVIDNEIKWQ